jgi:hypothetical protein
VIDATAIPGEAINVGRVVITEVEPPVEADGPCCAVCVKTVGSGQRRRKLIEFALEVLKGTEGKRIGRGRRAGRILLCERCWARAVADARAAGQAAT